MALACCPTTRWRITYIRWRAGRRTRKAGLRPSTKTTRSPTSAPRQQPKRQPVEFRQEREGTEDHFKNLFAAMRTREQPVENVEFGCGTAVACHMANLSYRDGGKRVVWDREKRVASV